MNTPNSAADPALMAGLADTSPATELVCAARRISRCSTPAPDAPVPRNRPTTWPCLGMAGASGVGSVPTPSQPSIPESINLQDNHLYDAPPRRKARTCFPGSDPAQPRRSGIPPGGPRGAGIARPGAGEVSRIRPTQDHRAHMRAGAPDHLSRAVAGRSRRGADQPRLPGRVQQRAGTLQGRAALPSLGLPRASSSSSASSRSSRTR